MYCPPDLHDSTSRPHDLATMQQVWQNIYNKSKHKNLPYKIVFTGGEVTANKNFLPSELKRKIATIPQKKLKNCGVILIVNACHQPIERVH